MKGLGPRRAEQGYRHEALLWYDAEDFTRSLVPFLVEALDAGEPVVSAVLPEHGQWLRDALGERADSVEFVDIRRLGGNPARVTEFWQRFLAQYGGPGRPVRGIGEIAWPGRRPEETAECQLHEALLNVAVDPDLPLWLVCPYEADRLPVGVVQEAARSHPIIAEAGAHRGSGAYGGRALVDELFGAALPEPHQPVHSAPFRAPDLPRLRSYLRLELHVAGLAKEKAEGVIEVVLGLVSSSLRRGAENGTLRIWHSRGAMVCEVRDETRLRDPLAGRRAPAGNSQDALWLANQVCDLVQLRSSEAGTAVRVHTWTSTPTVV